MRILLYNPDNGVTRNSPQHACVWAGIITCHVSAGYSWLTPASVWYTSRLRSRYGDRHGERQTSAMKNPCLRIMGAARNLPLSGYCSVCKNVKFVPTHELADPNQQQQWLKYLFNQHFAKVHLHQDRPQASQRKSERR